MFSSNNKLDFLLNFCLHAQWLKLGPLFLSKKKFKPIKLSLKELNAENENLNKKQKFQTIKKIWKILTEKRKNVCAFSILTI